MNPVKFKRMNTVYTGPGCDDLPALQTVADDGRETVTSVWKPTEEELKILNRGGCVCLSVLGGQPPVSMWVQEVEMLDIDVAMSPLLTRVD